MIVSHARRFVFFPDPLDSAPALARGFAPFADQDIHPEDQRGSRSPFSEGMTPAEAEWAFDAMGLAYGSYLRVAVVQSPFARLARLYDRIARTDGLWIARRRAGLGQRDFGAWLRGVRPDGPGAGGRNAPRWRRFGAWSGQAWCAGHVNHVIRLESVEEDVLPVLAQLGIAPGFDADLTRAADPSDWIGKYDETTVDLVARRYAWDMRHYGYNLPDLAALRRLAG